MANNVYLKRTEASWNDRAVAVIPCRCLCGRMVQRTANAPKTAYYSEGCKERHAKIQADGKLLKTIIAAYWPLYESCPLVVWIHALGMAHLISTRHPKGRT